MKIYENIEAERDRIQQCIQKYGWTSDHNLDWYADSIIEADAKPIFVEFDDGTGLLAHKYPDKWRIWSNPLCSRNNEVKKISEFALEVFKDDKIEELWCDDVSDNIYPDLKKDSNLKLDKIYYHLYWPVLDMSKYDSNLPGGHFKEMRNAKNKFYREHKVTIRKANELSKNDLIRIIDDWYAYVMKKQKEDIYDIRYRKAVENGFRGFTTARVMIVDGQPVGFNAGYDVPNHPGRFAGVIGIHDYSVKDLGEILYLEDFDWMKNSGYKEVDLQGMEYEWELKMKTQFGAVIERKTDTFSIMKK